MKVYIPLNKETKFWLKGLYATKKRNFGMKVDMPLKKKRNFDMKVDMPLKKETKLWHEG